MVHKYGEFSENQIALTKKSIRGSIFFLLLCVDNETKDEYEDVDVNEAFTNLLNKLGGLNSILFEPPELVTVISLLERAMWTYNKPKFNFYKYRKLLLDAGSEVLKIKEV